MSNPELENYVRQNPISTAEDAFRVERAACDRLVSEKHHLLLELEAANKAHDEVTRMVSRYLVACKGHVADSWMEGFIECGAVTYDSSYPTGFIAPVLLGEKK